MFSELTSTQQDWCCHDSILREDSCHDPWVRGSQKGKIQQGRRFDACMNPRSEKADGGSDATFDLFYVHGKYGLRTRWKGLSFLGENTRFSQRCLFGKSHHQIHTLDGLTSRAFDQVVQSRHGDDAVCSVVHESSDIAKI